MRRTAFIIIAFAIGVSITITSVHKKFLAKVESADEDGAVEDDASETMCPSINRCIQRGSLIKILIALAKES